MKNLSELLLLLKNHGYFIRLISGKFKLKNELQSMDIKAQIVPFDGQC